MDSYNKIQIGQNGEKEALSFLQSEGLRLLKSNYRCLYGEIDLIMQDGDDIVFIEVRHRNRVDYGGAVASVNKNKQRKIIKTALYFLQQQRWLNKVNCRFDVFGIHSASNKTKLEWIKNAFSLED